jgi:hypothetical protein
MHNLNSQLGVVIKLLARIYIQQSMTISFLSFFYVFIYLFSYSDLFLHTQSRYRRLLLHLIALSDRHTHTHTHAHAHAHTATHTHTHTHPHTHTHTHTHLVGLSGRGIGPSQEPLPDCKRAAADRTAIGIGNVDKILAVIWLHRTGYSYIS